MINPFEKRDQAESDRRQLEAMAAAESAAERALFAEALNFAYDQVNSVPGLITRHRMPTYDSPGGYAVLATTLRPLPRVVGETTEGIVSLDLEAQAYRRLSKLGQKYAVNVAGIFQVRSPNGNILDETGLWVHRSGQVDGGTEDYHEIALSNMPFKAIEDLHEIINLYKDGGDYKDLRIFQPPAPS